MASFTIEKRSKANGEFSYRCKIVVKKNNAIIHRESKTFRKKELARTSGKKRVKEIEYDDLDIIDLRYHDLSREGASRLFEQGYSIERVAQATGHRNLNILWQAYTQLFPQKIA